MILGARPHARRRRWGLTPYPVGKGRPVAPGEGLLLIRYRNYERRRSGSRLSTDTTRAEFWSTEMLRARDRRLGCPSQLRGNLPCCRLTSSLMLGARYSGAENRDMFTSLLAVSLNSASRGQCRTAGSSQDTLWVQFTYRLPGPDGGLQPHGILDLFFPTKPKPGE